MRIWKGTALASALMSLAALAALAQPAKRTGAAGEWPQFRGPERTGISRETGLLKSWPAGGPKLVWKVTGLGGGYTAPSVAGGRLFGMGYRGEDEVVWALGVQDGKEAWSTKIATANRQIGYKEGSRSTPTVDGDRVYALGTSGDLVCLDAASGKVRWHKNLVGDFGGSIPNWGYTESVLVDGEKLIAAPGGREATIVALNKMTGEPVWKSPVPGGDRACYSSAIAVDMDGKRQYIHYLSGGVVGVAAQDGKFLWRYAKPANGIVIATPVYHDHHVFASTAYQKGGGLVKLTTTPDGVSAEEVYFSTDYQNHHGGVILVDGYLYYAEGHNPAYLTCREFKTGKLAWQHKEKSKVSLAYADGYFIARNERGPVTLVEANPKEYVEKGAFDQPDRSGAAAWAHPVLAGGRLYLRDQDIMLCYDIDASP